jgi:osmoprotectant transport system permease protein
MDILTGAYHFIVNHPHLWLTKTGNQLVLSAAAIGIALAVSLPIGIVTGHLHRGSFIAISGANIARALPTLAVIAVLLTLVGIGFVNIMIALVVLAIPPILTNTFVAVDQVDRAMVEAGRGMGMRWWQILFKVELPNALPLIMAGVQTGTVFVIATAYLASIAGSNATLGAVITNQAEFGLGGVLGAAAIIVVVAFLVEGLLALVRMAITPRGLKVARRLGGEERVEVVSLALPSTAEEDEEVRKPVGV